MLSPKFMREVSFPDDSRGRDITEITKFFEGLVLGEFIYAGLGFFDSSVEPL